MNFVLEFFKSQNIPNAGIFLHVMFSKGTDGLHLENLGPLTLKYLLLVSGEGLGSTEAALGDILAGLEVKGSLTERENKIKIGQFIRRK